MTKRIKSNHNYRKIYKQQYGLIPIDETGRPYDIHHIDGNHNNNDISNLKAVTIQEHYDIHYTQGDYGACLAISMRMNISPAEKSEISRKSALARVEAGTHNFQGEQCPVHKRVADGLQQEMSRATNLERVKNGTHNLLGDKNPVHARVAAGIQQAEARARAVETVQNGTHPWLGDRNPIKKRVELGIQQKHCQELARKRVAEGTHNFQNSDLQRNTQTRLIEEGRHGTQQQYTCPHCGAVGKSMSMFYWHFDNCKELTGHSARPVNETHPSQIVRTCPHCGKTGKGNGMIGYHFDRCKKKKQPN